MHYALCTECGISQDQRTKCLEYITSKTIGPGWGTDKKLYTDDLLFNLLSTVANIMYGLIITRINRVHISIRKSPLSEYNCIPIRRNIIGHLLLEYMVDSSVCFTVITNLITYNTRYHMVVTFILVPHWHNT